VRLCWPAVARHARPQARTHAGTSEPRGISSSGIGRGDGGMRPVGPRGRGEAELQAPSFKVIDDPKDDFEAKCKALQFSVRFTISSTSSKYPGWRISSSLHNTPHNYEPLFFQHRIRSILEAFTVAKAEAALAEGIFHRGEYTVGQVKDYL
jgi:hypothetical protein